MKFAMKTALMFAIAICSTVLIQWSLIIGAMPTFTKIAEDFKRPISLHASNVVILVINAVTLIAAGELIVRASRRKFIISLLFTVLLFVTGSYTSYEGTRFINISDMAAAEFIFIFVFVFIGALSSDILKKKSAQRFLKHTISTFWILTLTGSIALAVYLNFPTFTYLFCAAAILRLVTIFKPELFKRNLKVQAEA